MCFGPKTLKRIYTVNTQPSELKFLQGFCDELEPIKGVTSKFSKHAYFCTAMLHTIQFYVFVRFNPAVVLFFCHAFLYENFLPFRYFYDALQKMLFEHPILSFVFGQKSTKIF